MKKHSQSFLKEVSRRLDHRVILFSVTFFVIVLAFERLFFKTNYRSFILDLLFLDLWFGISAVIIIVFSLFCFYVFCYISLASHWVYKILYFFLFLLVINFEYGYQNAFGRFSQQTDIQIGVVTTLEQRIYAITSFYDPWAILPVAIFLLFLIFVKRRTKQLTYYGLIINLSLFLVFSFMTFRIDRYTPLYNLPTVSFSAFPRTGFSYLFNRAFTYRGKRQKVETPQKMGSERPANNIVFVVAESLRGDHLSLNGYERKTTPFLDDLSERGLIHNWGIAASNSTCSIVSHDMLLTGFRPDELPDRDESLKKVPLIFQYAKAMGYKTFYMDAQMDSIWGEMEGDGISYVDERYNSSFFYRKVKNGRDIDFEIAKSIDRITSSSSGNFIFVFKRGVHFPYKNSFPEEAAVWKPSFDGSPVDASPEEQAAVINSYDNGIRYNLEGFFKNLTRDYNNLPNNTVYIYTGDHGQTLGDYGVNYPHCGVTKSEAIVPLFIIGNLQGEVDTKFKASHENIFATILDLMKYPDDLRKRNYAISLLKAKESDSKSRHYASPGRSTLGEHIPSGKLKFD